MWGLYFFGFPAKSCAVRALGLDVGMKTIGLALTDEAEIAAHPHSVLARVGNIGDAAVIAGLVAQHGVTDVVIGMPFELSGKIGHRAKRVQELGRVLRGALAAEIAMHEQDERFTTAEAERILLEADLSRARRKSVIDQQAAVLILQAWLDAHRRRA
jgi:putative Holliday junction resolvase